MRRKTKEEVANELHSWAHSTMPIPNSTLSELADALDPELPETGEIVWAKNPRTREWFRGIVLIDYDDEKYIKTGSAEWSFDDVLEWEVAVIEEPRE